MTLFSIYNLNREAYTGKSERKGSFRMKGHGFSLTCPHKFCWEPIIATRTFQNSQVLRKSAILLSDNANIESLFKRCNRVVSIHSLYLVDAGFKFLPGDRLSWLRLFVVFLGLPGKFLDRALN